MLQIDTPVLDLIYPAEAQPTPETMIEALGGAEAAASRMVLDVDLDVPQYEAEINPSVLLRRRGERRLLVVDESAQPMRRSPRTEPIVPRDLRAERERLARVVEKTGARIGRLQAFGSFGDAVIVVRQAVDLRAAALLAWALDPTIDVEGRRRANQLSQREFEEKLAAYPKRLEELDDQAILARVPPAALEQRDGLIVVDVLSDRDGSWDVRKSFELEKRLCAVELFARIPGARVQAPPPGDEEAEAPARAERPTPPAPAAAPAPAAPAPAPAAAPAAPSGPPIRVAEVAGRLVLVVPAERFDADFLAALAKRDPGFLGARDQVDGRQRDRIAAGGCGFIAPLEFLSEVFVDGKPLDKKRFEADARPGPRGTRVADVHVPRFGAALLIDGGGAGKRWVTSETSGDVEAVLQLVM